MEEQTLFIRRDKIAKQYELSFNLENNSFELKIKQTDLELIESSPFFQEFTSEIVKNVVVEKWNFNSSKFGFNNCFKKGEIKDGWITLFAKVSKRNAVPIAVTFSHVLSTIESHTASVSPKNNEEEQEMFLTTYSSKDAEPYGAVMKADLSPSFSLWIYNQTDEIRNQVNPLINKAIKKLTKTFFTMKPEGDIQGMAKRRFSIEPPYRMYSCQFGIEPDSELWVTNNYGYTTFCHNLDYEEQQLILLAGFLMICKCFRDSQLQKKV